MTRIVLIMEGLSSKYEIPTKVLKLFAFEIVAYFLVTPILDLVTTRADHRLYFFLDERREDPVFVCGEIIEYWISAMLLIGDLLLCSTTIGVYLYAVGEMIIDPIQNQKLIDICIRYAIFSIFASIFIMIGNGIWSTNNFSICRYIDNIFIIISIMFMLTLCTSCYLQCCESCHKRMRGSYITQFLELKEKLVEKEFQEIRNNPKYVLKSYDKTFDQKLTQILSAENLSANSSMDTYHRNVTLHHANSSIKSKKKLKKLKKKFKKEMSQKGIDTDTVNLNDRELQTMHTLLTFGTTTKFSKSSKTLSPMTTSSGIEKEFGFMENVESKSKTSEENENDVASLTLGVDSESLGERVSTISIKKGTRRKKNVGLLAHLNPTDSNLPKALTIAIHASVIDTVKKDDERKEMTDDVKIHKIMDELFTKGIVHSVDT